MLLKVNDLGKEFNLDRYGLEWSKAGQQEKDTTGVKEQLRLLKHFRVLSCFSFLSELYSLSGLNFNITLSWMFASTGQKDGKDTIIKLWNR